MKIQSVNNSNNTNFGMSFRLSGKTMDYISKTTKLSVDELYKLPISEAVKLMKDRGSIKEPSKLKQWFANKYKEFGEKHGLLKKHINLYTHID